MNHVTLTELEAKERQRHISLALEEDLGAGDVTAQLIDSQQQGSAEIITREKAVICGQAWVNEVVQRCTPDAHIEWLCNEGEEVEVNATIVRLGGLSRGLLSAERTALNYLQTLSAVATKTRQFVRAIEGYSCHIVDTRKTIPGLRLAQKYAVRVGGGINHRMGLYDAFLIKENHILAAGSIHRAYQLATEQARPGQWIEVEVETLEELEEALAAGADRILLDNMSIDMLTQAVSMARDLAILEISGGVNLDNVRSYAATGVQRISIGTLTKDIKAIDFSMRFK